jgi:hypothetical protein
MSNSSGMSSCEPCPPGSCSTFLGFNRPVFTFRVLFYVYLHDGCSLGTYQSSGGKTECLPCQRGTSAAGTGSQVCTDCSPGKCLCAWSRRRAIHFSLLRVIVCVGVGFYASAQGEVQCEPCKEGSYSGTQRSSSCNLCTNGS